jgi:hypothetical protein
MASKQSYANFDPPDLLPILAVEETVDGWRALTTDGEVLSVRTANGHLATIPFGSKIAIHRGGQHIGYRAVPKQTSPGVIDKYVHFLDAGREAMRSGDQLLNALVAFQTAASYADTLAAKYNSGMCLLELGHWREGFDLYATAIETSGSLFTRPQYLECVEFGLRRWCGEPLHDKRLLLIHDHGFGDSIMCLRYVGMLRSMGAEVILWLPPELKRLGEQVAPVVNEPVPADYFCSLLFLLRMLWQQPDTVPLDSYLQTNPILVDKWRRTLGNTHGRLVGVAWSPRVAHSGDYPRALPLPLLVEALPGVRLVSVQQRCADAGIEQFDFEDFADCAALMECCDTIVSIDTAAIHLAGAIGHPNIKLLLSYWSSWRWLSPFYQNIKVCKQDDLGDWASALVKL